MRPTCSRTTASGAGPAQEATPLGYGTVPCSQPTHVATHSRGRRLLLLHAPRVLRVCRDLTGAARSSTIFFSLSS